MSKCGFEDQTLSEYVDGNLLGELESEVREHISECERCGEMVKDLKRINNVFAAVRPDEVRVNVSTDAQFYLKLDEMPAPSRGMPVRAIAMAFSAVILFAVLAVGVITRIPGAPVVTGINGIAYILRGGTIAWTQLEKNMLLEEGDMIKTEKGSAVNIALASRYYIKMKEDTQIKMATLSPKYAKGEVEMDLARGDILVDITSSFAGPSFNINTELAGVHAAGEKFMVSAMGARGGTWVGVLDGEVKMVPLRDLDQYMDSSGEVIIKSDMKAEVLPGRPLLDPVPLIAKEWDEISETYMLDGKAKVVLLVGTGQGRLRQLLAPCDLLVMAEGSRDIPDTLVSAMRVIMRAVDTGDETLHQKALSDLENVVASYPDADYNTQILMFVGAYYYYLDMYKDAIRIFDEVQKDYPSSGLAPLALCASAVIYEEDLRDSKNAVPLYTYILERYPLSPEADLARNRLS